MQFRLRDLVAAGLGDCLGSVDADFDGASIDSRSLRPGQLFVAIRAERDGHEFAEAAVLSGAPAVMVDHPLSGLDAPQLVVGDTTSALAELGRLARRRIAGPVVGITGSVGKTTTKDLLASIFRLAGPSVASARSLNNELGVPLTLLDAPADVGRAVVEMGARDVGHIALLCEMADPTIGVVTTVAAAHLEIFGSIDAIARAKGELVEALPADGAAVLTHENPWVEAMASRTEATIWWFGQGGEVVADEVRLDPELRPCFRMRTPVGSVEVTLAVRGRHNVNNALAAAAAALAGGVSLDTIVEGLAHASLSPWRMSMVPSVAGGIVIDDSYNANPASMRAGFAALCEVPATRRVAIVGLMAELGDVGAAEHRAVTQAAHDAGIELVAVGTALYGDEFDGVRCVADVDTLIREIDPPKAGVAVLVKGSRVAGLERVAQRWGRPSSDA